LEWKFAKPNANKIKEYSQKLNISSILATVFVNRKISLATADRLIHHTYDIIEKPLKIYNINEAADFFLKCIKEGRPIHIFADYDCDGLTSGYIMCTFANNFKGIKAEVYYPERIEKYGLSKTYCYDLIRRYKNKDLKPLVITVDNGITKKEEVKILRDDGFEVLVTDHHLVDPESLPEDCMILDPYLTENKAGRNLCGAGVAWNLCRAIEDKLHVNHNFTNSLLYAAAIGTLADVMPLDTYNIALTTLGLAIMSSDQATTNIKVFRRLFCSNGVIDSDTITWTLAPMLNACGRMGDVQLGANFFFESNEDMLIDILGAIKKLNEKRKEIENKAVEEVEQKIDPKNEVICVEGHTYPVGIHGLIAGKVTQKYNKPAIVLKSLAKDDILVGSCRSNTVPLNTLMTKEKNNGNLVSFGGHAFAGGISVKKDKKDALVNSLDKQIRKMKDDGSYDEYTKEPSLRIDDTLTLHDINNKVRNEINTYAYDNKMFTEPIWAFRKLSVEHISPSRNNPNHLKFTLSDGKHSIDLWGWNIRDKYKEIGEPNKIDIAGQLVVNFMKPKQTTIRIVDIRKSET
jgi:single-stranded-DNA-specific exonuclease